MLRAADPEQAMGDRVTVLDAVVAAGAPRRRRVRRRPGRRGRGPRDAGQHAGEARAPRPGRGRPAPRAGAAHVAAAARPFGNQRHEEQPRRVALGDGPAGRGRDPVARGARRGNEPPVPRAGTGGAPGGQPGRVPREAGPLRRRRGGVPPAGRRLPRRAGIGAGRPGRGGQGAGEPGQRAAPPGANADAETFLRQALDVCRRRLPGPHPVTAKALGVLGDIAYRAGKTDDARAC